MIRVTQVLFNFHPVRSFALIAIPASIEMLFATNLKTIDIVGIMGGMSLTESEEFLLAATHTITMGSVVLFLVAFCLAFCSKRGDVQTKPTGYDTKISVLTWIVPVIAISLWGIASISPQKRLSNLQIFQGFIRKEKFAEAARFADSKSKDDFPPHRRLLAETLFYNSPQAALCLASFKEWPSWLYDEFSSDVSTWLESSSVTNSRQSRNFEILYHDVEEAPFVIEFAAKFTPGIDPYQYFPSTEEDQKPTP